MLDPTYHMNFSYGITNQNYNNKELELKFEGYCIKIFIAEFDIQRKGIINTIAKNTMYAFRNFPQGWSRLDENTNSDNKEEKQSNEDRLDSKFE